MRDTALITGATGFMGPYITRELAPLFDSIILLHRESSRLSELAIDDNIQLCKSDPDSIEDMFKERGHSIEGIVHLATHYAKSHAHSDIANMIDANISLPLVLLSLADKYGLEWFINTGTCFEYAPSLHPITETSPLRPVNLYAQTKASFYDMIQHIVTYESNLRIMTLRPFYAYGVGNYPHKLIQTMVMNALTGKDITIDRPYDKSDFINVKDIVTAYRLTVEFLRENTGNEPIGDPVLNIGSGEAYTPLDIVKVIESISDLKPTVILPPEAGLRPPRVTVSDSSRARNLLGWNPKVSITEGIGDILSSFIDILH